MLRNGFAATPPPDAKKRTVPKVQLALVEPPSAVVEPPSAVVELVETTIFSAMVIRQVVPELVEGLNDRYSHYLLDSPFFNRLKLVFVHEVTDNCNYPAGNNEVEAP